MLRTKTNDVAKSETLLNITKITNEKKCCCKQQETLLQIKKNLINTKEIKLQIKETLKMPRNTAANKKKIQIKRSASANNEKLL